MPFEQGHHRERGEGRHERHPLLPHVAPVLDRGHDRRVGGRTADLELLEPLDERRLVVAGRRLGLVSVGAQLDRSHRVALGEWREATLLGIVGGTVGVLDVDPAEALVGDDRAAGGELGVAAVGGGGAEAHGDSLADGVGHLRRDRAVPDHLVDPGLGGRDLAAHLGGRSEPVARGSDRLVGLLGVLHLRRVDAGGVGQELGAVPLGDLAAGRGERGLRQRGAVGTHVGDVALLVEGLGGAHRLGGRQAELAAGLLLEGGGHERRRRTPAVRPALDRAHREGLIGEAVGERPRRRLVERDTVAGEGAGGVEVAARGHLRPVDLHERGLEARRLVVGGGRGERALDVPVGGRDERHALALTLDDDAGGDALHPSGRQLREHLLPQHRRHLVAVEAVEQPARLLRVDEATVEVAGLLDRPADGLGGDLVEHHPLHRHLRVQRLEEVPRDGLALAVLIGGEIQLGGVLQQPLQPLHDVLLLGGDDVERLEVVVDVDAETRPRLTLVGRRHLGGVPRQVADVPDRGFDDVVVAEIARDGAGLGG